MNNHGGFGMISYEDAKKKALLVAKNLEEMIDSASEYDDAYIFYRKASEGQRVVNTGDDPPIVVMKKTGEVMLMQEYVAIAENFSELRDIDF